MGVDRRSTGQSNSPKDTEKKTRGSVGIYVPPALRKSCELEKEQLPSEKQIHNTTEVPKAQRTRNKKLRRPDIQVYVPRAKRCLPDTSPCQSNPNQSENKNNSDLNSPTSINNSVTRAKLNEENVQTNLINSTFDPSVSSSDKQLISSSLKENDETSLYSQPIFNNHEHKKEEEELKPIEKQNLKNRRILHSSVISDVLVISDPPLDDKSDVASKCNDPPSVSTKSDINNDTKVNIKVQETPSPSKSENTIKLNPDECTWDMMFDDSGECLVPSLLEELTSNLGQVSICKVTNDYSSNTQLSSDDAFAHVLEIYDFPAEFKTPDLLNVFSTFKNGGFEIKWVDDTHALGVFSSPNIAAEVLRAQLPFVKTRPLREATSESKQKARRSSEFLQPYRPRPETCPALARRLVTGALGVRLSTSREEREAEKKILTEARQKKRLAARQKDEAWEGTLTTKNSV